ncbi:MULTISPECIES: serine hydrolase domain-containing protein [Chryseobacterium]|uniref:CubicO group peptidase (Beta-lactamase class C family) n=1 Tax=Chryseobacterium camelliae TaxID=1265445 RepID=A0ABU0TMZ8_9FLAO|nr:MULTISPECIES: serine hydrolase [Chryseobacterium]MDT3407724.1 CubicO group peptidase (beta-lactamase class C family) [Pseudacidovorax intermedius]MDQ1098424.1 CubicO group peptidase (beta-lactamase class C family) [Chryseobacterium camelliae]MDQ1102348.1 CubicO group peptidase (beta-lactamase class C family) [Chryseobacterium sp. SORGH_AS_1048]MDR6085785.1 CubicO group peptidase (beta-lactamase class C family) [Chryseobacterium sp. SORGH_AS_0909]MDR6130148.1 CubicO group peptidase (beta-lac
MLLFIQIMLIVIAVAVILVYLTGYGYIFNGISKTYFKGKLSANIDDGSYFPSNTVATATPKPWEKAPEYNTRPLPEDLIRDLEASSTASFIVVKNGRLVHEQYWDAYHATSPTNSFSMAKAVTVMLLGKAIEEQKIHSLDDRFSTFFPEFDQKEYGKELTLKQLAIMESGLDWEENYKNPFLPNAKAYYGTSLISAIFSRKFKEQPGNRFEYQSGSTQLLGFAVRKAINQSLASYLSEKFWIPLGMEHNATWSTDESGMEKTYCCIHSNARDFAKLGQLFLDNGKAGQRQILNEEFIEQMRTPTEHSEGIYGMGLWINHDNPVKHYYFLGLQGQYIIMIPEYNMVIVRTGSYHNLPKNDRGRPDQVKFLVNSAVELFQ